jgi:CubicO group peptidase (beta-lactamase class C family)
MQSHNEPLDRALDASVASGRIPGVVAAVATQAGVIYEGTAGRRSIAQSAPMTRDTLFRIASMTKAITAAAAMQLVERGKLSLDQPAREILPLLGQAKVLTGFNADGPILRPPRGEITLRRLLTHSAGFAYEMWNPRIARYVKEQEIPPMRSAKLAAFAVPLANDPGERWEYGVNIEMVGRMVEAASGLDLESYLQAHILAPLGMHDTSFIVRPEWQSRLAALHRRTEDGSIETVAASPIDEKSREFFPGGGGLYATAPDYLRFLRALMNGGELGGARILKAETVALMGENHVGQLQVQPLPTQNPQLSNDVDFMPGIVKKWGLSFLINTEALPNARRAGSLAWAGLNNTYFWLDPAAKVAGVFMTQLLPFADAAVLQAFDRFERAVYSMLGEEARKHP